MRLNKKFKDKVFSILKSKTISRSITVLVILITLFYFGKSLSNNWEEVSAIGIRFNIFSVLSILSFAIAVIVSGMLWERILITLDANNSLPTRKFVYAHIASWLLKYIPGQAGSFLGKLNWSVKNGISKRAVSLSFLYENIFLVISSFILSISLLFIFYKNEVILDASLFLPILLLLPLLIVFQKNIFYKSINYFLQLLGYDNIESNLIIKRRSVVAFVIKYFIPRVITALGFIFIVLSVVEVDLELTIISGATYILAGVVGLMAFLVPSGLGVREAIIVLLLSPYLGEPTAIILSIYARFFTSISDILLLIFLITLNFNNKK